MRRQIVQQLKATRLWPRFSATTFASHPVAKSTKGSQSRNPFYWLGKFVRLSNNVADIWGRIPNIPPSGMKSARSQWYMI